MTAQELHIDILLQHYGWASLAPSQGDTTTELAEQVEVEERADQDDQVNQVNQVNHVNHVDHVNHVNHCKQQSLHVPESIFAVTEQDHAEWRI